MTLREELIQVAAVAVAIVQDLDEGKTSPLTGRVFYDIGRERDRQEEKWGPQHHSPEEWLAILAEEVGEAAREVFAETPLVNSNECAMGVALFDAEEFARAFLKERFGPDAE